jgi:hypothetical protein
MLAYMIDSFVLLHFQVGSLPVRSSFVSLFLTQIQIAMYAAVMKPNVHHLSHYRHFYVGVKTGLWKQNYSCWNVKLDYTKVKCVQLFVERFKFDYTRSAEHAIITAKENSAFAYVFV